MPTATKRREISHHLPHYTIDLTPRALTAKEHDWPHRNLLLEKAWKASRGAGILVGLLDTGCQSNHPDLQASIKEMKDFTRSRRGPEDSPDQGHGTHCAGVIAAVEDDKGIMGVAPDLAKDGGGLLIGKVLGDDGSGQSSWIAKGVLWAASKGARIISMSLGSPFRDEQIIGAIKEVLKDGVIVICAAGNEGQQGVGWPGAFEGVISVAAYDKNFKIAPFSSRGPEVDIAAPGVDILSTIPTSRYARMSGTSMATPHVTGIVALLLAAQKRRKWDCESVKAKLIEQAQDAGSPGFDSDYGYGLIRPDKIEMDVEAPPVPPGRDGIVIGDWYLKIPAEMDGYEGLFAGKKKTA